MKKAWNIISIIFVSLMALLAVLLAGVRLVGLQPFTVTSGSMRPAYSVGSMIYVKQINAHDIKVGDAITFMLNEDNIVATHRVIRIDTANHHFYTKGDANEFEDGAPVHFSNLIGRPIFCIPIIGYISTYVSRPPGLYIAIGAAIILVILTIITDSMKKIKKVERIHKRRLHTTKHDHTRRYSKYSSKDLQKE